jgi:three-Cys-motif partner protein
MAGSKRKKQLFDNPKQPTLFEIPPPSQREPELRKPKYPVWTENKALLIKRYLFYFVMVTKHGTYLDCFAGPQDPEKLNMWAAKLVLESEPRWLRQFLFCETSRIKQKALAAMIAEQSPRKKGEPKRAIEVLKTDCNRSVPAWLADGKLKSSDATFCLLDQRTFECHWKTVQTIASYKTKKYKIEQFYFLANSWLERAIAGIKTPRGKAEVTRWWGRDDWPKLSTMTSFERAELLCERFRSELGYKSAKAWPIYEKKSGGKIMYFMIHATDHPDAPGLMARAYERAVQPLETKEQLSLVLDRRIAT